MASTIPKAKIKDSHPAKNSCQYAPTTIPKQNAHHFNKFTCHHLSV